MGAITFEILEFYKYFKKKKKTKTQKRMQTYEQGLTSKMISGKEEEEEEEFHQSKS